MSRKGRIERPIIVDKCDEPLLYAYRWSTVRSHRDNFYASARWLGHNLRLHRVIAGACRGDHVDHINGNGLDNRRSNLRLCTQSNNSANARLSARSTSGFKGVCRDRTRGLWIAHIMARGKRRHIGRFASAEEAARAYDSAARELFGEYARTNAGLGLLGGV